MIVNNANLVTLWPQNPFVEGALVAIEGKSIVDFGKVGKLIDRYDDPDVLDVGGRLVVPGMVNAYTRLHPPGNGFAEGALDEEALYWTALTSLLEALRSGVTTLFLAVSSPAYVEGSLGAVRRAFTEVRLRGALSQVVSPRSVPQVVLRETARHLETCRGPASEWMRGLVAVEVTDALDDDILSQSIEAAGRGDAPLLAILPGGSQRGWARLRRAEVSKLREILAHGGEPLSADEAESFRRDSELSLAHAAQADILAGVGSVDLEEAQRGGLRFVLGTGGCGQSMTEEFRVAVYRQRALGCDAKRAQESVSRTLFVDNPDLATRTFGPDLGRIKPGARADLVVLDFWPPVTPDESNWTRQFFWAASRARVHSVIVSGRLLYHNGAFVGLDEERIRSRAREATGRLWERS